MSKPVVVLGDGPALFEMIVELVFFVLFLPFYFLDFLQSLERKP